MKQCDNIFDFFLDTCGKYSDRIAFIERKKYRRRVWTYQEAKNKVLQISEFLKDKRLAKGDKVIVCSPNNVWWDFLYFACAYKGIILVPLDSNSSTEFIKKIVLLTEAKFIFFSKYLPQASTDFPVQKIFIEDLPQLLNAMDLRNSIPASHIQTNDILEIVFSSGSTGEPKGVVLTNRNICSNLYSLASMVPTTKERRFLSIVPLSHMLEQTAGLLSPMLWGASIVYPYTTKPRIILQSLQEESITSIICVPAFLQILRNSIVSKIQQLKKINLEKKLKLLTKFPTTIKRIFTRQIRATLGRNLNEFYVGGAPLDSQIEDFWDQLGVSVFQGYGMTEASPLVSTNTHKIHKPRSVGKILPNVSAKLSVDGEILIKGPNVSGGYFQNSQATKESFEDGWLKSGDIGEFDKDGFLFVRGRKKNTIIGPSGMKIYPEDIEEVLRGNSTIKDAVVCGLEQNSNLVIVAVVVTADKNISQNEIANKANEHLASHQKIQEVIVWPAQDFPRTPTKKVIRAEVCEYVKSGQKTAAKNIIEDKAVDTLSKIVADVTGNPVSKISPQSNFVTDLKLDSIKRLELVSRIEEEFGIELDESKITHKSTVQNLRETVSKTGHGQRETALPEWPMFKPIIYLRALLQLLLFSFLNIFQSIKTDLNKKEYPQPAIFIANHQSHLDAPNVLKSLPGRYRQRIAVAAAKDYFFSNKFRAFWARLVFNALPLDRESNIRESLKNVGALLDRGWSILIFPEGTRTKTGEIQPFKNGIGVIAQEMEVPIVPIRISGNFEILPKGKVIPKPGKTNVSIGDPITFTSNFSYIQVTNKLEEILKSL